METATLQKAKNRALNFLSFRPRSIHETRHFLQLKRYSQEIIDQTLTFLIETGFLDDAKFAAWWVDSRCRAHPSGPIKLKTELKQKGVSAEIINQATNLDYLKLAKSAAQKFARRLTETDPQIRLRKLQNYLQRQGFTWDQITSAIPI
jgi:regulatory protein